MAHDALLPWVTVGNKFTSSKLLKLNDTLGWFHGQVGSFLRGHNVDTQIEAQQTAFTFYTIKSGFIAPPFFY